MKKVIYNGETGSYYPCSDPSNLITGKEYEVINEKVSNWHTEYTLKGVEGKYNSVWFDEVKDDKVYMAIGYSLPIIGQPYNCYKINFDNKKVQLINWRTSNVQGLKNLGNKMYEVRTLNSIYYVKLDSSSK